MKDQLQQKQMKLSDGTYAALSLMSACETMPETVSNLPHALTRDDICTILKFPNSMATEQLLNTLIHAEHILKYTTESGEARYIFPRLLPSTLHCDPTARPWSFHTMCGRFLTLPSGSVDVAIIYQLIPRIVHKCGSLPVFEASQDGVYFEVSHVQCSVKLVKSRKGVTEGIELDNEGQPFAPGNSPTSHRAAVTGFGIEVVVCSQDTNLSFSGQILTYCVRTIQRIQRALTGEDVEVGVISSRDLMKGNLKSAHVYSSAEVSHAQKEGQQLLHPDHSEPESFASVLLVSPTGSTERNHAQVPSPLETVGQYLNLVSCTLLNYEKMAGSAGV